MPEIPFHQGLGRLTVKITDDGHNGVRWDVVLLKEVLHIVQGRGRQVCMRPNRRMVIGVAFWKEGFKEAQPAIPYGRSSLWRRSFFTTSRWLSNFSCESG